MKKRQRGEIVEENPGGLKEMMLQKE